MAKTAKKPSTSDKTAASTPEAKNRTVRQYKVIFGTLLLLFSVALVLSFVSFYIYGHQDQSTVHEIGTRTVSARNWLGKLGAYLAHIFVYQGVGLSAFFFVRLLFLTGAYLVLDLSVMKLRNSWFWDSFLALITSILFGFFATKLPELAGVIGFEMNDYLQDYLGKTGTLLSMIFGIVIFLIFRIKISPDVVKNYFENTKSKLNSELDALKKEQPDQKSYNLEEFAVDEELDEEELEPVLKPISQFEIDKEFLKPTISNASELNLEVKTRPIPTPTELEIEKISPQEEFVIEKVAEEVIIDENIASRLVADFGLFDPTLELSNYKFPTLDLLKDYATGGITINQAELEENKNRIVETLRNYKIEIAQIKATVGPSVTLYEIVPEAGIRISKIKSLEDDIALSLSALGIRIIAPIPGKARLVLKFQIKILRWYR